MYDQIHKILTESGFKLEQMGGTANLIYRKARQGVSLIVSVPIDCDNIPDSVITTIMETAEVPPARYSHLLGDS